MDENDDIRRPLGLTLMTGLYLFFFILSTSTFGSPFPFMGSSYLNQTAKLIVLLDSLICLYLFIGILKRQLLTWYFLICYNFLEIINTIVNLTLISPADLEKILGKQINVEAIRINNIAMALAILLLTQYIYRHKHYFTNRQKYLF